MSLTEIGQTDDLITAIIQGKPLDALPNDLYIPRDGLKIFLEAFEGPLDLLLYLIQRQHFNIFDIPIAEITQQYLRYVELMKELHFDLAAEYLLMAAELTAIKSRMLLPKQADEVTEPDPREKLVKQLQEYARYKQAAQMFATLPQVGRDVFLVTADVPDIPREIRIPSIPWRALLAAMQAVMVRTAFLSSHQVLREPLSVRERMSFILERLKATSHVSFGNLFTVEEGRAGVVVTFLAILELTKESIIKIIQTEHFAHIEIALHAEYTVAKNTSPPQD
jgi:segregation and condensation protein A